MPSVTDYEVPQLIRIYKQKKKGDILTPEMYSAIDTCVASHIDEGNSEDEAIKLCMIEVRKQSKTANMPNIQTFKGSFRTVVDLNKIASDNNGKLPEWIQVMPCGEFLTLPYGPMILDSSLFQQILGNFNAKVRAGDSLPIDTDHDGGEANGWMIELEDRGDQGLWAKPDWNSLGTERLGDKRYKFLSPEWTFDYVNPLNSQHHGGTLIAASLTNRPLFSNMIPLVANESSKTKGLTNDNSIVILVSDTMNKDELIKKGSADPKSLTKEERKFLRANVSGLSADKIIALELNVKRADETDEELKSEAEGEGKKTEDEVKAETEAKAKADQEAADAKAKADADVAAKETPEQKVSREEAEAKLKTEQEEAAKKTEDEKKAADEAAKTAKEKGLVVLTADEAKAYKENQMLVRQVATEKEVAKYLASERGGKVYPKSKDSLISFVMTCSEVQKTALFALLDSLPELKVAGEIGESKTGGLTAKEKLDKIVDDRMKASDNKLSRAEMLQKVISENSVLANEYNEELKLEQEK